MANFVIDKATSGVNSLISGVAGKKIFVHHYLFIAAGSVTVKFGYADDATGTNAVYVTGAMTALASTGAECVFHKDGHFVCPAGKYFIMTLSGNVQVSGHGDFSQR